MTILCVIPVRGGSKGVPRKNVRTLAGKPLVAWTIEQALDAKCGLEVLVSTDDEEIATVARAYGASVPFIRPVELSQDQTATEPVVLHALEHHIATGHTPEAVMLLQATSPLRLAGTLDRAVSQFRSSGVDSMVGVVAVAPFLWGDGAPAQPHYDYKNRPRRQDLLPEQLIYRETGSLYVTRPEIYQQHQNRLGGEIGLFIMDEREGVDIDTEVDFSAAEQQMFHLQNESQKYLEQDLLG